MNRLCALVAVLALPLVAGCPKPEKGAAQPDNKRLAALEKQVGTIDKRLAKIENLLAAALEEKAEPDPDSVYAVSIEGDPWAGTEHAPVTLVEGFEFA